MYDTILDALRRNAPADALLAARELLAEQPENPQAHRLLASALRVNGDHEAALASIDHAIALAPEQASLHLERAGLLMGGRRLDEAQQALAQASGLDPNQFEAHVLQAQLALGRGDLGAAEQHNRLAARIAPDHAEVAAVDGMLALRRGDPAKALSILSQAAEADPENLQVRYALGFAYLEQGHLAFAEQAFRGVLEKTPDAAGLRGLVSSLVGKQGNPGQAAAELVPLLDNPASDTLALRMIAGGLEMQANRPEQALVHFKKVLAKRPDDRRVLASLTDAWRQLDARDDARATLEAALATTPASHDLWLARLMVESQGDSHTQAVVERWLVAMPEHIPALEARMSLFAAQGDNLAAESLAHRIVKLEPGRSSAEMLLVDSALSRDPQAGLDRVRGLIAKAADPQSQWPLRSWMGLLQDGAGRFEDAAATWTALAAEQAPQRLPLPPTSTPREQWPALASFLPTDPMVLLLWGLPGSGVERLAAVFNAGGDMLSADRFGPNPPADRLQNYDTVAALAAGTLDPAELVSEWGAQRPARGYLEGHIIDWLVWWDNALLLALRPHMPGATLLIALRDPRDMLLDWLAFGAPAPFALTSPQSAAGWLAVVLNQVATLHEKDLFPHRLVRLDDSINDPGAVAAAISTALETNVPAPASFGQAHFPAGHWRDYADALAVPFAMLTPVAKRLGYPEH